MTDDDGVVPAAVLEAQTKIELAQRQKQDRSLPISVRLAAAAEERKAWRIVWEWFLN